MTARTHDVAAAATLLAAVAIFKVDDITATTALIALLANQIGGIAPDIDQPTAPLWRNLPVGKYFGRVFGALIGGHRFLSHSLVGFVLFGILSWAFLQLIEPILPAVDLGFIWFAFLVGVASHLFMDMLTKEGVPLLLPLPYKFGIPPWRSWRITTGKKIENFVVLPLLTALVVWLAADQYDALAQIIRNRT